MGKNKFKTNKHMNTSTLQKKLPSCVCMRVHFVKPLNGLRGTRFKKRWYTLIPLFNRCCGRITMARDQ